MIDETSGIIGWPIGQQYREMAARDEDGRPKWETLVEQYRERAARDDARIDELRQSTEHWHDTAQMLMRQRNMAEEERDSWKIRAMQSEQQRQALRDLLVIAEGQRDQAKADAEHWKGEWAVVMGQLGGARDECDALRQDAALLREFVSSDEIAMTYQTMKQYRAALLKFHTAALSALAVQPTTGEGDE